MSADMFDTSHEHFRFDPFYNVSRAMHKLSHPLLKFICVVGLAVAGISMVSAPRVVVAQQTEEDPRAAKAYKDAERSFKTGDYLEAIRRYNLLRSKFPYSELATLADLRIADAYFEQEKYATSVEQYRAFAKLHPEHERVPYANWRVALSFYKQMPTDWWFMPPGYERDLNRAEEAERELLYFVQRNPDSEFTDEARTKLKQTRRRLADHELYVAKFYLKRDNPRAAAMRLSYLLQNYQGLGLDPQALFLLARAYIELKDVERATDALADLIEFYPDHPLADDARDYIERHNLSTKKEQPAADNP